MMRLPSIAESILLLAAIWLIPAGRRIAGRALFGNDTGRLEAWIDRWQLPAALSLLVGLLISQGAVAAALSTPWFIVTVTIAISGLCQFRGSLGTGWPSFAAMAGHVLLVVGGLWTWLSRAGLRPMEFSDEIVLLTGVHFHYAGFVLPLILGVIVGESQNRAARVLVLAVIAAIPMVGVGIAMSPGIEIVAALWLSFCCVLLAGLQIRIAVRAADRSSIWLLISSISLVSAMILASVYAVGEFFDQQALTIPMMIATHGLANSIGFAICGIWGWRLRLERAA